MSAEVVDTEGAMLTVNITGRLTRPELDNVQKSAANFIRKQGKVRILVVADNFQGWESGDDWGGLSFQKEYDRHIEKMAIVGERKWKDLALVFACKGLRRFPIEYFEPAELTQARAWLATDQ